MKKIKHLEVVVEFINKDISLISYLLIRNCSSKSVCKNSHSNILPYSQLTWAFMGKMVGQLVNIVFINMLILSCQQAIK